MSIRLLIKHYDPVNVNFNRHPYYYGAEWDITWNLPEKELHDRHWNDKIELILDQKENVLGFCVGGHSFKLYPELKSVRLIDNAMRTFNIFKETSDNWNYSINDEIEQWYLDIELENILNPDSLSVYNYMPGKAGYIDSNKHYYELLNKQLINRPTNKYNN